MMKIFENWADLAEWYKANNIYSISGCECTKSGCRFGHDDHSPSRCSDFKNCTNIVKTSEFGVYAKSDAPFKSLQVVKSTTHCTPGIILTDEGKWKQEQAAHDAVVLAWFNVPENRQAVLDRRNELDTKYGLI